MATATGKKMNKTAFVTEFLRGNPQANATVVNEAWQKAGHPGTISTTLVQNVRSDLGLVGNLRSRGKAARSAGAAKSSKPRKKRRMKKAAAKANGHPRAQANGKHVALSAERKTRSSDRDHLLEQVEGDIDRLIFKLMVIGEMEDVEDDLRRVRRLVVRSHQA
jgi:hypothetical protein